MIKKACMHSAGRMVSETNSFAYIMDKKDSIDIDDHLDFKMAEMLMQTNLVNE